MSLGHRNIFKKINVLLSPLLSLVSMKMYLVLLCVYLFLAKKYLEYLNAEVRFELDFKLIVNVQMVFFNCSFLCFYIQPTHCYFGLKLIHCVVHLRSLSQNSSVLPEEEDEKSCSESEADRHKPTVDQQEVCLCVCVCVCVCVLVLVCL